MTDDQKRVVAEMLRTGPLDLGGDVHEQRRVLVEMFTAFPLPDDVVATPDRLGGVEVVSVEIAGVSTDDVVVYLHGGAYALGTAASSVGLVGDLARRAGVRGVTVDYRLAPESPYPAALDDAVAVYEALLESTDPRRIAFVGESAGGGLVLATLVALRARDVPMPAAAAVFSPWADLTLSGGTIDTRAGVDPALTATGLRTRATDYVGSSDASDPLLSPVHADLTGLPPLLVQAGSNEILLDDAIRVAAAAARADVEISMQITPGVPHVFQAFAAILDEGAAALDAAGEFLRAHLDRA
ncbi:alpha/beta hydrolase [Williamsia phyllosphaerae]|uniref:Alpha/beta hydrolase n=1 Tax=Williamsia phyllosphaerae TaxID=885042 RepID=A0ABQ1U7R0_9NOCA|nr:alpha/beta hydrolase [Williamsia phyllosphaerae]GGF10891.1 alpha/beta hydrolase [Williamsia phyllosphaerae]